MAKAKTSWIVWALCGLLALLLTSGLGLVFLRLRPYWVAKYRGQGADLQGAFLAHAPLAGADLHGPISGALLYEAPIYEPV